MKEVYVGIIICFIIYLSYLLFVVISKRHLNKYIKKSREVNIVKKRYDLNMDKLSPKFVANIFGLGNGIVIGITYIIVMGLMHNFIIRLISALFIFIVLMLIEYMLIGKILKRKEAK